MIEVLILPEEFRKDFIGNEIPEKKRILRDE